MAESNLVEWAVKSWSFKSLTPGSTGMCPPSPKLVVSRQSSLQQTPLPGRKLWQYCKMLVLYIETKCRNVAVTFVPYSPGWWWPLPNNGYILSTHHSSCYSSSPIVVDPESGYSAWIFFFASLFLCFLYMLQRLHVEQLFFMSYKPDIHELHSSWFCAYNLQALVKFTRTLWFKHHLWYSSTSQHWNEVFFSIERFQSYVTSKSDNSVNHVVEIYRNCQ